MCRYILPILPIFFFMGCLSDPQHFRYPNLLHPGHISRQHAWAEKFDPYASPEVGPKIVGDRPSGALDATPASMRQRR